MRGNGEGEEQEFKDANKFFKAINLGEEFVEKFTTKAQQLLAGNVNDLQKQHLELLFKTLNFCLIDSSEDKKKVTTPNTIFSSHSFIHKKQNSLNQT